MLISQYFRVTRGLFLGWLIGILSLCFAIGAATSILKDAAAATQLFQSLPDSMVRLVGGEIMKSANPVDPYVALKGLSFLPAVLGIWGALTIGSMVVRERESGTIDYLLALPIRRRTVLVQRFVGFAIQLAVLYVAVWLGIFAGIRAVGQTGSFAGYAVYLLGAYAINLAQGGLLLWLSLWLGDWTRTLRVGLFIAFGCYLVDATLRVVDRFDVVRNLLLYGLLDPYRTIIGRVVPWPLMLAGATVAIASLLLAVDRFARQDLAA